MKITNEQIDGLLGVSLFVIAAAIAIVVMSLLTGCAAQQAAVKGYENAALVGIRAAEDNNIAWWSANACGTPYSAAIRNPQIVPALRALCLPGGNATNPSTLLDAIPGVKTSP